MVVHWYLISCLVNVVWMICFLTIKMKKYKTSNIVEITIKEMDEDSKDLKNALESFGFDIEIIAVVSIFLCIAIPGFIFADILHLIFKIQKKK
jgi:L-asparagine transporter-like permease